MILNSFSSISNDEAKVLILGTMPGIQSLKLNQYYGHNRNAFWKIIFTVFDAPFSTAYEDRKTILLQHNVAVWDVLKACVRKGSLDSAIEQEVPNDFTAFLEAHPILNISFLTGSKQLNISKSM